mmetsp:Transcript_12256/g.22167  ORF Transcript_12256/g.22167 Transcript_12256/m.22167 type:complete len:217 (+) Transcript_12256:149-799(+)
MSINGHTFQEQLLPSLVWAPSKPCAWNPTSNIIGTLVKAFVPHMPVASQLKIPVTRIIRQSARSITCAKNFSQGIRFAGMMQSQLPTQFLHHPFLPTQSIRSSRSTPFVQNPNFITIGRAANNTVRSLNAVSMTLIHVTRNISLNASNIIFVKSFMMMNIMDRSKSFAQNLTFQKMMIFVEIFVRILNAASTENALCRNAVITLFVKRFSKTRGKL